MYSKGLLITLSCVVAGIIAAPTSLEPAIIPIVSQSEEIQSNGTYKFSYETGNGIIREESAYVKLLPKARDASSDEDGENNESEEIHVQRGSYSYTAPDGTVISVRYIADENGFQPIYEHTPNDGNAKSADKSGRALKLDTSESSLGLAPRIGSSQSIEVDAVESTKPKTEVAPEASSEPVSVPAVASVPEEVPAVDSKTLSVPITNEPSPVESEAEPKVVSESLPAVVPEPTPAVEAATTVNEAIVASTENAESVTESGATEASESTIPNVDVSTEVASTAAPDQPSTEPEKGSTASAELPSTTAPEQSSSSEVVESSSSTSAPEQSNTTEAVGQQAIEGSVASSPAEEIRQPAPNSSEPSTPEESSFSTISDQ